MIYKLIFSGGLAVYHDVESTNNDVIIQKLRCDSNTAIVGGGCMDYLFKKYTYESRNRFIVEDMISMSCNSALIGFGGVFSNHKRGSTPLQKSLDESCATTVFKGKQFMIILKSLC